MTAIRENQRDEGPPSSSGLLWQDAFKPIPRIFRWYKNHAAAGTLILAAFLVVKGYVIARANLDTALGILQYAGLTSTIIAGLLSSLPILTALMLGWIVFRMGKGLFPGFRPESRKALACVLAGAFGLSAFFTPLPYMVAALCLGFVAGLVAGRWPRQWQAKLSGTVVWLIGVAATVTMLYTLWVPHEIVMLSSAPTGTGLTSSERTGYVLGYVLADDPGGWITILTSGDRTIVRFREETVKSIAVCQRIPHGGVSSIFYASPLWNAGSRSLHILAPGTYRKCP